MEYKYPKLEGTEKQIEWAGRIRREFVEHWDSQQISVQSVLNARVRAEFWIKNRNSIKSMNFLKEQLNNEIIRPINPKYSGVVKISQEGNNLIITYKKEEKFVEIMKQYKLYWNKDQKRWERKLSDVTGSFSNRAAEVGIELLESGFSIQIKDYYIREKIRNRDYKHEWKNCIGAKKTTADLILKFEKNDELYEEVKNIKDAIWENNLGMIIHVSQYKAVETLAAKYGFEFTYAARTKIRNYQKDIKAIQERQKRTGEN